MKSDRETGRKVFNKDKSRTREIAHRRVESCFEKYRNQLRDPHEINGTIMYQFFEKVCGDSGIKCISANGNGNILKTAEECGNNSLIVADGAAFGPQMANVYEFATRRKCNLFFARKF